MKEIEWYCLEQLVEMIFFNDCKCPEFGCNTCAIYYYHKTSCLNTLEKKVSLTNSFSKEERYKKIRQLRKQLALQILIKKFPYMKEQVEEYYFEKLL